MGNKIRTLTKIVTWMIEAGSRKPTSRASDECRISDRQGQQWAGSVTGRVSDERDQWWLELRREKKTSPLSLPDPASYLPIFLLPPAHWPRAWNTLTKLSKVEKLFTSCKLSNKQLECFCVTHFHFFFHAPCSVVLKYMYIQMKRLTS